MLSLNAEMNGRCALAAIDVLAQELERMDGAPESVERLRRLARMARGHVAELAGDAAPTGRRASSGMLRETGDEKGVQSDAKEAWASAKALRQAKSLAEAQRHRARLEAIAARTASASVRRICASALA
ncbi:hypothetical protein [Xanthobacter autotrophicus]|uniref:hypothetical protein n=1 Tax=Xanthobacter autotrophicus TaxID=280 RepID=UPI00372BD340